MNQEQLAWLSTRPAVIQDMVRKYPPDKRYRNTETGQLGYILAYSEDGTVRMVFDGHTDEFINKVNQLIQVEVFGVCTDDIQEYVA